MQNINEKITKLEKELKELKESIKLEKWQDKLVQPKEQAGLVKEKMLLMQEILAFAHVRNEGWEADWRDGGGKYGIVMVEDEITVKYYISVNAFIFGISVKSKEIAEEMLAIFGERIEKYYNKQY